MEKIKFIDLFCGIGGFRVAMDEACKENNLISECVFSSDIDKHCQDSYEINFGHRPAGDITTIDPKSIPDHDILFAGFPCQPFSIIGQMKGFDDTRGTLFFHIANILKEKKTKAFVLENVKQLVGHNKGQTLKVIIKTLQDLGYHVQYTVLNALDYGLPQKRERVIIVGHKDPILFSFPTPIKPFIPLSEILEKRVDKKHHASDYIKEKRKESHKSAYKLSIWHENKSGNITSYPYSCALRAGASYNYLLVNGERRLTPREMFRLQGFPDTYKITTIDSQARKQAGNAVPVNLVKAVVLKLLPYVAKTLDMTSVLKEYEIEEHLNE
ncbi:MULTISPECIES: DNA cytosine methyltransferase [Elizabethkingia]|nr:MULTISPECIES: DNA (cytosine-5-)-methyltransferase [Elizabethkingia]MCT3756763.1 DNA (cytosine-5-)-methyltransferase [Elizabethkingia anophelis]MCT3906620.1 DNA (cytosine-5-)-methyltransferase [Elizabethkingia anophelis]MCT4145329.1 DNA (cytosine-5-)-methyltransferase [Elizabethkingia anophelis]MCT4267145.1 DNA (cytosine-5-)-methyltransferase [Elizabethkingia anophelis]MCT4270701.1 DNA (cytosine-5-)-methyltransferase [Elizabethkingia anophelis]